MGNKLRQQQTKWIVNKRNQLPHTSEKKKEEVEFMSSKPMIKQHSVKTSPHSPSMPKFTEDHFLFTAGEEPRTASYIVRDN